MQNIAVTAVNANRVHPVCLARIVTRWLELSGYTAKARDCIPGAHEKKISDAAGKNEPPSILALAGHSFMTYPSIIVKCKATIERGSFLTFNSAMLGIRNGSLPTVKHTTNKCQIKGLPATSFALPARSFTASRSSQEKRGCTRMSGEKRGCCLNIEQQRHTVTDRNDLTVQGVDWGVQPSQHLEANGDARARGDTEGCGAMRKLPGRLTEAQHDADEGARQATWAQAMEPIASPSNEPKAQRGGYYLVGWKVCAASLTNRLHRRCLSVLHARDSSLG